MLGLCSIGNENNTECYNDATIPWPMKPKKKFTVAVEGNIGSGKSTFLRYFDNSKNAQIITEPVEMWKNLKGHNLLDVMYKDPQRWAFAFQTYVQLTMLKAHQKKVNAPVKLMERSIYSAKYCFLNNLLSSGRICQFENDILGEWFDWVIKNCNVNVDLIVYIQASPESCLERMKKRNRSEEAGVPLEYLQALHELHEDWLILQKNNKPPCPVLVIDADQDLEDLTTEFERRRSEILCGHV